MARIEYGAGMARDGTGVIEYPLGSVETEEGIIELYAEAPVLDNDETGTYDALDREIRLREEILEQAVKQGVDVDSLVFYYG